MGFHDKTSRVNHEIYCDYRTEQGDVPFHDYLSGETTQLTAEDWINMGVAGTNQNQDHDVIDLVEHVNELGEFVARSTIEDCGGIWLTDMQDLGLSMALEMERDDMDLNQNPMQDTPVNHEATSIWEMAYDEETSI